MRGMGLRLWISNVNLRTRMETIGLFSTIYGTLVDIRRDNAVILT